MLFVTLHNAHVLFCGRCNAACSTDLLPTIRQTAIIYQIKTGKEDQNWNVVSDYLVSGLAGLE